MSVHCSQLFRDFSPKHMQRFLVRFFMLCTRPLTPGGLHGTQGRPHSCQNIVQHVNMFNVARGRLGKKRLLFAHTWVAPRVVDTQQLSGVVQLVASTTFAQSSPENNREGGEDVRSRSLSIDGCCSPSHWCAFDGSTGRVDRVPFNGSRSVARARAYFVSVCTLL